MTPDSSIPPAGSDRHAALFTEMVMQYASMALMFLGRAPHPETGQTVKDLDGAQMFIAQLEMIEARTKGNLTPPEESILRQSLMTTRLAFVEEVERPPATAAAATEAAATKAAKDTGPTSASEPGASEAQTDERKKFVKKY